LGPSDFRLFLWDSRPESPTCGRRTVVVVGESNPMAVWVPPGVVHAYRNIGKVPGLVFNAPNRLYAGWGKQEPVDEIRHEDAGLVAVIAACALTLAALKEATEFWLGVAATLTAQGLLFASIRAVTGPARPFWAAAAVSGGLYLILAFAPWCRADLGPGLPTNGLVDWAHRAIGPRPRARLVRYDRSGRVTSYTVFEGVAEVALPMGPAFPVSDEADLGSSFQELPSPYVRITAASWSDDREVFDRIGHVVVAWALALIGGLAGHGVGSLTRWRTALDRVTPGSKGATGYGNRTSPS
jgi:hypothetical protein